jgi:cellulose synthase operon protein YhjU
MTQQPKNTATPDAPTSMHALSHRPRLGLWNFYFIAKLVLFWRELIGFHPLENLAFAAFLLTPISSRRARLWRRLIAIPIGIALLYYDSWLPPISRAFSQASLLSNFSLSYLMELLGRFISWPVIAMLVIAWALYRVTAQHIRLGVPVVAALLWLAFSHSSTGPSSGATTAEAAPSSQAQNTASLDNVLSAFHAQESRRVVHLTQPEEGSAPFDVLFIHICSLSWDDLQSTGLEQHPLWQSFDFVLRNFNSAASYSGPAAVRVNRALCGQPSHAGLYSPAQESCYLMNNLKQAGFATNLVLNHDGHFDDFLALVQEQNMRIPPLPVKGLPVPIHAFDDSPIYDDLAVLNRWMESRQKNDAPRVAAYYNTVTLHDGNHIVAAPNLSSQETYKQRLSKFLDEMNSFIQQIEHSNRRTVVVVIPEHGAAFHGDKMQISGLREIPSPAITLVPVGIKVFGGGAHRQGDAAQISEPTSYLAISHIIAKMLEVSPYGTTGFSVADYTAELPQTEFVAENEANILLRHNGKYYLNQNKEGWKEYAASPAAK